MQVNISAEIKHSPETGSNRSDRLITIFVASFNLNYPYLHILYNQIKRCQERIRYHRHHRFYMTDKDKKWGTKTKWGRKQHILHKLTTNLDISRLKTKQKSKTTTGIWGMFCCGCR